MLIKKLFYRELVSNASKIFIVLLFILPVTELFKLLDGATDGSVPTVTLLTMMIYGTIASFPMILTIASFLTIVITINRYCKEHEFAIWLASGVSPFYWLRAVAIFSLPLMLLCAVSTMYITPWATKKEQDYTNFLVKQEANMALAPGIFKENSDGSQVFYIEHYSLNPSLAQNIFIEYRTNSTTTYNITARAGKITNDNGMFSIVLESASRYELGDSDNQVVLHFKQFKASIKQQYNPQAKQHVGISALSVQQLMNNSTNRAKSELSWRISIAIMLFVMCLLALPISIQVGRVQSSLIFILPPIIYAVYENAVLSLNGYINDGKLAMGWIFILHGFILLIVCGLTYIKTFPKGYIFSHNKT